MAGRTRPIEKFAAAVAKCSKEVILTLGHHSQRANTSYKSIEYGNCIVADYNNVRKDKCVKEFLKLQECYTVRLLSARFLSDAHHDVGGVQKRLDL